MARFTRAAALAADFGVRVSPEELWQWNEEAYSAFSPNAFRTALARSSLTEQQQEDVCHGSPYENAGEALYPGVSNLLSQLADTYGLGIIANQTPGLSERLESHRVDGYFRCVLGSGDIGISKPALEIFELAAREVTSTPERMIMIGDRVDNDIRPANDLGWHTVRVRQGIARGQKSRCPMETPDHEIVEITELITIV